MSETDIGPDRASIVQDMGIQVGTPPDGMLVRYELPLTEPVMNPFGALQGGVVATLIDVAGGTAAAEAMDRMDLMTTSMNIHYLHAANVGPIAADGRVLRSGRTTAVAEVELLDLGQDGRVCAVGTVAMSVLGAIPPEKQPGWADAIARRRAAQAGADGNGRGGG